MKRGLKILSLILSLLLLTVMISACGSTKETTKTTTEDTAKKTEQKSETNNKGSEEKVELVVATITGPPGERLKLDAEAFMKENPNVTVKVNEYEEVQYKEQAPRMFLSDSKPDVAWYWADRWYHTIVKSGALIPLDDLYESEGWNQVLPESTLTQYTSPDGKKYSVNIDVVWTPVVYYNKKIFEEVGIQVPKTFDEWYEIGDKLNAKGYIPLVSGVGEGYVAGHVWDAVIVRSVEPDKYLKLLDRSKKYDDIDYTSPEVIDAWKTMKKMAEKLFPKGVTGIKDEEARGLFVQGKAAMYSNGSWAAGDSMLGKELPEDFELGFFYYPQLKEGIKPTVGIYAGDALMVINGTGKEEIGKKFVAYVMSKERQAECAKNKMFFPARIDLAKEDIEPMGEIYVSMYEEIQRLGGSTLWDGDIPGEMANLSFQLHQAVMAGSKTPEDAGKELQALFEKILAEGE